MNKSKTYLLPLLIPFYELKFLQNIVNTYIFIEGIECDIKLETPIFAVKYNYDGSDEFVLYENSLENNKYFIKLIDDPITCDVIYVFKIPIEILIEYQFFLKGKYSKYRPEKKQTILNYIVKMCGKVSDTFNDVKGVLFKLPERKVQLEKELNVKFDSTYELSSIYNKQEETFQV